MSVKTVIINDIKSNLYIDFIVYLGEDYTLNLWEIKLHFFCIIALLYYAYL